MIVTQVRFSFCVASHRGLWVSASDEVPSLMDDESAEDWLNQYVYIQVFTAQWKAGSRNRTRTVRGAQDYFRYIEKLYHGGYLSALDFDHAAGMFFVAQREAEGLFRAHNIACTDVPLSDMLSGRVSTLTNTNRYVRLPRGMIDGALELFKTFEV